MSAAWDEAAWEALATELARWRDAGSPATFWWRDDDAGHADPALPRLLALAEAVGVPVGLAVVPDWLTPEAAEVIGGSAAAVAVLQHGFAHTNHETRIAPGERKIKSAECGGARPAPIVLDELVRGQAALRQHLGPRWLPVLVPPWNRIAPALCAALPPAGYRALSTFGPRAAAQPIPGLHQVNCHADPIVWREAKRFAGAGPTLDRLRAHLVARRSGGADPDEPTGLLTHHRDLSPDFWAFLGELWPRLAAHAGAALPGLATLLGAAP